MCGCLARLTSCSKIICKDADWKSRHRKFESPVQSIRELDRYTQPLETLFRCRPSSLAGPLLGFHYPYGDVNTSINTARHGERESHAYRSHLPLSVSHTTTPPSTAAATTAVKSTIQSIQGLFSEPPLCSPGCTPVLVVPKSGRQGSVGSFSIVVSCVGVSCVGVGSAG